MYLFVTFLYKLIAQNVQMCFEDHLGFVVTCSVKETS